MDPAVRRLQARHVVCPEHHDLVTADPGHDPYSPNEKCVSIKVHVVAVLPCFEALLILVEVQNILCNLEWLHGSDEFYLVCDDKHETKVIPIMYKMYMVTKKYGKYVS